MDTAVTILSVVLVQPAGRLSDGLRAGRKSPIAAGAIEGARTALGALFFASSFNCTSMPDIKNGLR